MDPTARLLPEILQQIFMYLDLTDLESCSEVCKEWKTVASSTTELKFKNACKAEFVQVYKAAYYKSSLSWEELYKSLRLWPEVLFCNMYLHYSDLLEPEGYVPIDRNEPKKIQVIKNGVIGYPHFIHRKGDSYSKGRYGNCNSILYYDPETLQEIDRMEFDFNFDLYEENEHLIAMRSSKLDLQIVTKINKRVHNVGKMVQYEWGDLTKFYLVGNTVLFMSKNKIWYCKVVFENNEATIKSSYFANFDLFPALNIVAAFAYINDNQVNLLTQRGYIYSIIDQKLNKLCRVQKEMDNRNEVVNMLKQHGFDWSAPEVYRWICNHDIINGDRVAITHLKNAVVHSHYRVVFIGTSRRVLHIYYNPYVKGQLKLYNRKPTLKIDLNDHVPYIDDDKNHGMVSHQRQILQIDCMEIPNGHRIIMLYCQRLVALKLRHEDNLIQPTKRRLTYKGSACVAKAHRFGAQSRAAVDCGLWTVVAIVIHHSPHLLSQTFMHSGLPSTSHHYCDITFASGVCQC